MTIFSCQHWKLSPPTENKWKTLVKMKKYQQKCIVFNHFFSLDSHGCAASGQRVEYFSVVFFLSEKVSKRSSKMYFWLSHRIHMWWRQQIVLQCKKKSYENILPFITKRAFMVTAQLHWHLFMMIWKDGNQKGVIKSGYILIRVGGWGLWRYTALEYNILDTANFFSYPCGNFSDTSSLKTPKD